MLLAVLQVAFRQKSAIFGNDSVKLSYIMQDYNSLVRQMIISPPTSDVPAYIFLHANEKISDLEINGDFGNVKESGLVWNQATLKIFNVLVEMKTEVNSAFHVARWAQKIIMYSSYIDVEAAIINLDVFHYFSITQSSLLGVYLFHNRAPYGAMLRENAFFTQDQRLEQQLTTYAEPCLECFAASIGPGCANCLDSTMHDDSGECRCIYHNYQFSDYQSSCNGQPEYVKTTASEVISGVNVSYFYECKNNYAFKVDYNGYFYDPTRISFFKDDSCGLSNIFLTGTIDTISYTVFQSEMAGIVFVKTANMSNSTINLTIINREKKMLSITTFARNITSNITIENLILSGVASEQGRDRTNRTDIRVSVLFHHIQDVELTIKGLMIHNTHVDSYFDGTYNSLGIGVAVNCVLKFSDIYMGDTPDDSDALKNPLIGLALDPEPEAPSVNCSDRMPPSIIREIDLHNSIQQYIAVRKCYTKSDSSLIGGLFGLLNASRLEMSRAVLAAHFQAFSTSYNGALLAARVNSTYIHIQLTSMHVLADIYNFSGAIGAVTGASDLRLSCSLNLSSRNPNSGFATSFDGGKMDLSIYINATMTGGNCAAIAGNLIGGEINLLWAFGQVNSSGEGSGVLVGVWKGGIFNTQQCESANCKLEAINESYVNTPVVDGVCTPSVGGKEPIGPPGKQYFQDCQQNIKFKVSYTGKVPSGSLTIFNPALQCQLVGVTLQGKMTIEYGAGFQYGIVLDNSMNGTNVVVDMQMAFTGDYVSRIAMIAATNQAANFVMVVIKGKITCQAQSLGGCIGGITAYAASSYEVNNAAFYGFQIEIQNVQYSGFMAGDQYWSSKYYNIIIDDYSKAIQVPSFESVPETAPAAFRCSAEVQDDILKRSLLLGNLLVGNLPSKRSSITITGQGGVSGCFVGRLYDTARLENVSILIENRIEKPTMYAALMFG